MPVSTQSLNLDAFARTRCHNHSVFTYINANMVRRGLLTAWHVKVDYIPRLHRRYFRSGGILTPTRGTIFFYHFCVVSFGFFVGFKMDAATSLPPPPHN